MLTFNQFGMCNFCRIMRSYACVFPFRVNSLYKMHSTIAKCINNKIMVTFTKNPILFVNNFVLAYDFL